MARERKGQPIEDEPPRKRRTLLLFAKLTFWTLVALFAVEAGEYGTSDLLRVRGRIAGTKTAIDSLRRVADSLSLQKRDVMSNPAVQERIAREEFGMVKGDRELVYHVLRPDSGAVSADSASRVPSP
ncbi:MAG TPA: septum formation initiator family protein [Gemmatimonadaceae bacterium]|nr:septum formation initiator family protein [Gemmatimonadaceae bacterium]